MPPVATVAARDFLYIVPEMVLTVWGLALLLVDVGWLRTRPAETRRRWLGGLALAGIVVALAAVLLDVPHWTGMAYDAVDPLLFFGTIAGDPSTFWLNLLVVTLLGIAVSVSIATTWTDDWGEFYALLFWAAVAMMLLIASSELITLFLTLETMTLCLYLLSAFQRGVRRSPEAGLKYFVYGSVSSALFLFGLSLLYGMTGTTRLDAIRLAMSAPTPGGVGLAGNLAGVTAVLLLLVGFGFKVAAVPFHQWAPDTYEGAPAPISALIASGSKVASFIALMKVFNHALIAWAAPGGDLLRPGWLGVLAVVAAITMTYGNLAALAQRNFKRLLAYSSIAHAGYILVGVVAIAVRPSNAAAAGAVLFYLIVYGITTAGAFAVAAWLARDVERDDIDDLNGIGQRSPGLAVCIVLLMLSLIGVPPMAGFFGKLYMFMEALNSGEGGKLSLTWLVGLALANSVVSAFYYVRVIKAMFLRAPGRRVVHAAPMCLSVPIVLATVVVVGFGVESAPLLETMRGAAGPMLSYRSEFRIVESSPTHPDAARTPNR